MLLNALYKEYFFPYRLQWNVLCGLYPPVFLLLFPYLKSCHRTLDKTNQTPFPPLSKSKAFHYNETVTYWGSKQILLSLVQAEKSDLSIPFFVLYYHPFEIQYQ